MSIVAGENAFDLRMLGNTIEHLKSSIRKLKRNIRLSVYAHRLPNPFEKIELALKRKNLRALKSEKKQVAKSSRKTVHSDRIRDLKDSCLQIDRAAGLWKSFQLADKRVGANNPNLSRSMSSDQLGCFFNFLMSVIDSGKRRIRSRRKLLEYCSNLVLNSYTENPKEYTQDQITKSIEFLSDYGLHASNVPCPKWGYDPRFREGYSKSDIVTRFSILSCARLTKASDEFPLLINLDTAETIRSGRLLVLDALLEALLNEVVYCYATNSYKPNKTPEVVAELRYTLIKKGLISQVAEVIVAKDTLYKAQSELMAKLISSCSLKNEGRFRVVSWDGIDPPSQKMDTNRDPLYDDYLFLYGMNLIDNALKLAAFADPKVFRELLSLVSEFSMLKETLFPEVYGFFLYIKKSKDLGLLAKKIKDEPSSTLTFTQENNQATQMPTPDDILEVIPCPALSTQFVSKESN